MLYEKIKGMKKNENLNVLILVLLENALWVYVSAPVTINDIEVLILVLLENALWGYENEDNIELKDAVLILVFVENALWVFWESKW